MNDIEQAFNYLKAGKYKEAETLCAKHYTENIPEHKVIVLILAEVYAKTGQLKMLYRPNRTTIPLMMELANYYGAKRSDLGLQLLKKILQIDLKNSGAWNNLGILYEEVGTYEQVVEAYKKSIEAKPNLNAYMNLSSYHRVNNELDDTIFYAQKAMELKPDFILGNVAIGTSRLTKGDFAGYATYAKFGATKDEWFKQPWDGTPHPDKKLLLYCDQGLGDSIMFLRYLPYLTKMFKKVNVAIQPELKEMFMRSFPIDISSHIDASFEFHQKPCVVEHDYYMVSLYAPYYLNMDFAHIPLSEGYLVPNEEKVKMFKEKYFQTNKLKVGLCWRSTSNQERIAVLRNMDLSDIKELFDIPNIQFYSFQKEKNEQLDEYPQVIQLHREFNSFDDTLAAMKNLDLMLTIDTSVLHLAGASGIKTILMLPYGAEWRWFQDKEKTPWYDSVEIYRQTKFKYWGDVVERVIKYCTNLSKTV